MEPWLWLFAGLVCLAIFILLVRALTRDPYRSRYCFAKEYK